MVMTFARRGFPFTELKLRKLAYELAKANRRKGFSPEKNCWQMVVKGVSAVV